MMKPTTILIPAALLALTACNSTGANYEPIVDGPTSYAFSSDLAACKQLARKRGYFNDDVKAEAVAGAVVGGVLGAIGGDSTESTVGGAIVGGAVGAGERAWKTKDERKQIVINCMAGRGHNVVG